MTKEWTPLAPGNVEQKYYAKGVGLVLIKELKEKNDKTNAELTESIAKNMEYEERFMYFLIPALCLLLLEVLLANTRLRKIP